MNSEENELITQILNGDAEAYGLLIDRYKTGLYYDCFKIVRDEDAAEDITQDTLVRAYEQLPRYDHVHRFSTWLYKIATHKALDYCRRRRTLPLDDDALRQLASSQPGPEDYAHHQELRQAVNRLPSRYRTAISLRFWEGRPYDEIAAIMETPVGSIKGWISRAKALLRKDMS